VDGSLLRGLLREIPRDALRRQVIFFFFFYTYALLIDRSIDGGGWVPPKGSAERYSERRVAEAGDIIGMFIYMFLFIFH